MAFINLLSFDMRFYLGALESQLFSFFLGDGNRDLEAVAEFAVDLDHQGYLLHLDQILRSSPAISGYECCSCVRPRPRVLPPYAERSAQSSA